MGGCTSKNNKQDDNINMIKSLKNNETPTIIKTLYLQTFDTPIDKQTYYVAINIKDMNDNRMHLICKRELPMSSWKSKIGIVYSCGDYVVIYVVDGEKYGYHLIKIHLDRIFNSIGDDYDKDSKASGVNNRENKSNEINNKDSKKNGINNRENKTGGINNRDSKTSSNKESKTSGINNKESKTNGINNRENKSNEIFTILTLVEEKYDLYTSCLFFANSNHANNDYEVNSTEEFEIKSSSKSNKEFEPIYAISMRNKNIYVNLNEMKLIEIVNKDRKDQYCIMYEKYMTRYYGSAQFSAPANKNFNYYYLGCKLDFTVSFHPLILPDNRGLFVISKKNNDKYRTRDEITFNIYKLYNDKFTLSQNRVVDIDSCDDYFNLAYSCEKVFAMAKTKIYVYSLLDNTVISLYDSRTGFVDSCCVLFPSRRDVEKIIDHSISYIDSYSNIDRDNKENKENKSKSRIYMPSSILQIIIDYMEEKQFIKYDIEATYSDKHNSIWDINLI